MTFFPIGQSGADRTPNPPHADSTTDGGASQTHHPIQSEPERNTVNTTTPRMRGRTARLSVAAVAALSLVAAACGDDADDDEAVPATTEATAPTEITETTMAMEDGPFGDGCAAVPADGEGSFDGMADDPAATAASNNPVLSTLVAAVTAAGLGDTLNSEGPFTIFAPTNDAFGAIPADDLDAVLADTELLTSILTYHV
ncbi:MAG TPA: fasciclin domain-containing protein, partial [Ilumatobacter sp.]|nr:fasciclin domain-containing protein [Ilumatobacter sp.]